MLNGKNELTYKVIGCAMQVQAKIQFTAKFCKFMNSVNSDSDNYWYDAAGERTVKSSGGGEGVSVNGIMSGGRTGTTNFTAYISPYLVVSNGGYYTKHIYMGSQRIVSKLASSDMFASSPVNTTDLKSKYNQLTMGVKARYDSLGVEYRGVPQGSAGLITSEAGKITTPQKYFYHSDHLGSSSLITDGLGNVSQHLEYVPFGEVFVEERNGSWSTPYRFNGKEQDEETGLCYYGARYYDPKTSVWISVDPLAEKYAGVSSYVYCIDNPVNAIDPDGREIKFIVRQTGSNTILTYKNGNFWHSDGKRYDPGKESLSKTLYSTLASYRKILSSGDKALIKKLKTLEKSERTHWVEASQVSENNVRPCSGTTSVSEEKKIISEGKGIGTQTQFDFSEQSKKDFKESEGVSNSDFTTVVHEMQHQYDYDTGKMGDSLNKSGAADPAEKRAVNSENRARKIDELPKRTTYGGEKIKGID